MLREFINTENATSARMFYYLWVQIGGDDFLHHQLPNAGSKMVLATDGFSGIYRFSTLSRSFHAADHHVCLGSC